MGTIYLRGKTWWVQYYRNGKPYRESARTNKKMVARKLLEQREGAIAEGKLPGIHFDKVRFSDLAEDFLRDYRVNGKKSLPRAERSVRHLKEAFEGLRVIEITTARIQAYIEGRLQEGACNATINRELSALKRMLNLGAKQTPPKVDRVPYVPMLKENNVRDGFFEHGDFLALRDALPNHLRGLVTFAYKTGWRVSEITGLTWRQVDLEQGIVRLEVGTTKNDEGRTMYLDDELKEVFSCQKSLIRQKGTLSPYVFPNREGTDRIRDFRGAWDNACKRAGIGKKLFHDFRRTAVRNIIRAGVPERVAMMISGHKTRSVFDRYNIVSASDLKQAAKKQEEYLKSHKTTTKTATILELGTKKRLSCNA
jgi:integrase